MDRLLHTPYDIILTISITGMSHPSTRSTSSLNKTFSVCDSSGRETSEYERSEYERIWSKDPNRQCLELCGHHVCTRIGMSDWF